MDWFYRHATIFKLIVKIMDLILEAIVFEFYSHYFEFYRAIFLNFIGAIFLNFIGLFF